MQNVEIADLIGEDNWVPSFMTLDAERISGAYKTFEGELGTTNVKYGFGENTCVCMPYEDFLKYWGVVQLVRSVALQATARWFESSLPKF